MPKPRSLTPTPLPGDPADPHGFAALGEAYFDWMRVKNYSERTIANRRNYLRDFVQWCDARGLTQPADITPPLLERYQRALFYYRQRSGRPLSFRSQHTRLTSVRAFFKWLARQRYLLYNPAAELELPKLEKRLPQHVLTEAEAETILALPDLETPLGLRDRAILEVLYSTGIRRMEVIGLQVYDLDAERGTLMIRQGKGRKDRMVPVGERAVGWIDAYLRQSRPHLVREPDDGVLFLTAVGTPLSRDRLSELVRNYILDADIGKTGSCHLFRHTVATLMLEHGADIRCIQQLLGHANLDTTQIYTQVSIRQLKAIHTATHPAARARAVSSGRNNPPDPPESPED
jgi:integrase/recombinase XerD